MPNTYIKCPATGKLISTGIDANEVTPINLSGYVVKCFHCEQAHFWNGQDLIFLTMADRSHPENNQDDDYIDFMA